jgi:hypothetical protein
MQAIQTIISCIKPFTARMHAASHLGTRAEQTCTAVRMPHSVSAMPQRPPSCGVARRVQAATPARGITAPSCRTPAAQHAALAGSTAAWLPLARATPSTRLALCPTGPAVASAVQHMQCFVCCLQCVVHRGYAHTCRHRACAHILQVRHGPATHRCNRACMYARGTCTPARHQRCKKGVRGGGGTHVGLFQGAVVAPPGPPHPRIEFCGAAADVCCRPPATQGDTPTQHTRRRDTPGRRPQPRASCCMLWRVRCMRVA